MTADIAQKAGTMFAKTGITEQNSSLLALKLFWLRSLFVSNPTRFYSTFPKVNVQRFAWTQEWLLCLAGNIFHDFFEYLVDEYPGNNFNLVQGLVKDK